MAQDRLRIDDVRPQGITGGYVDEGDGLESGFHDDDDNADTAAVPEASPLEVLRFLRRRDVRLDRRDG